MMNTAQTKEQTPTENLAIAGKLEEFAELLEQQGADGFREKAYKNAASEITRVWTQFSQHLIAKSCTIDKKLMAFFSNRVASLRMSFILQKNRSTMLRIA
jgi:hypothetical protein